MQNILVFRIMFVHMTLGSLVIIYRNSERFPLSIPKYTLSLKNILKNPCSMLIYTCLLFYTQVLSFAENYLAN